MASAWRNAMAAGAVLAVLGALVAVPAVIDAVLPDEGPVPPGDRLDVGYGVSLRPPAGARLDLGSSRPGNGDVVLLSDGVRLALTAVEVRERPADYTAHTRHKLNRDEGRSVGPAVPVQTGAGVRGQRADLGAGEWGGDPGCAAIFAAEDAGVLAVISPVSGCAAVPADLWAAVVSLTFEPLEQW